MRVKCSDCFVGCDQHHYTLQHSRQSVSCEVLANDEPFLGAGRPLAVPEGRSRWRMCERGSGGTDEGRGGEEGRRRGRERLQWQSLTLCFLAAGGKEKTNLFFHLL